MHILQTKGMTSVALVALSSLACINHAYAKINFAAIPPVIYKPGDVMLLQWTDATNITAPNPNTAPFALSLRALSGQRYSIVKSVPQTLFSLQVTLPKTATGGYHSFYADYSDGTRDSSNQFNISGNVIATTTVAPILTTITTVTGTIATSSIPTSTHAAAAAEDSGLSGAALGGIIGGVVALLLLIALIFFFRHRRLVRERSQHTRLDDSKETYSESSIARAAPPTGPLGGKEDGMVPVSLSGGPGARPARPDDHHGDEYGGPRSHQMEYINNNRNPFDGPDDIMMGGAPPLMAGATSLSPRQQHQAYQPPQSSQQPPRPMQGQQQPYGMPDPMMQQRNQSPFQQSSRDSFESELESAYDPNHNRMVPNNINGPIQRNNSNPMMRSGGPPGSQLSHSPSGRSIHSESRQQQNPFQDRELMAAAAGGAAMAAAAVAAHHHQQQKGSNSPIQAQRQLSQNQHSMDNRSQSPLARSASPRMREIEMQPLEIQQHQYEQQQRALQRQQLQQQLLQQQQQQQQGQTAPEPILQKQPVQSLQTQHQAAPLVPSTITSSAPTLAPLSPAHPFNPTLYDDKAEVDDEGTPVYNGYRDTIFGAYSQPMGEDEEDDEEATPVPVVPSALVSLGNNNVQPAQQQQPQVQTKSTPAEGATGVTRKKSVKFTGVPASGPIEVPGVAQVQDTKSTTPQTMQTSQKLQHQMYHSEGDDDDDADYADMDDEEYEDAEEDEDDIKMRLMETEVPSAASAQARPPFINTTPGQSHQNALSPIRSPDQTGAYGTSSSQFQQNTMSPVHAPSSNGFVTPPAFVPQKKSASSNMETTSSSSSLGDDFYEDVLAAVDKNSNTASSSPTQQQQHIPPPQPQQFQPVLVEKQVFGAPSPRMKPASVAHPQQQGGYPSPPAPTSARPALSPRSAARPMIDQQQQQKPPQRHLDDEESQFYESSIL